ncbi:MAG: rod shape-determining protein MreD [Ruminococcaceae bacterium]|nr:rod shape-determining protein MreD [Oscillospiraceae bacterium]
MKILSRVRLKWVAYALELLLVCIVQYTPNLLPTFLGVKPLLLSVFAISIAMFEGETSAMWFGCAAGILMDVMSTSVFGFNTIMLMVVCYFCGALVIFLMRNNIVSAMVLGVCGLIVIEVMRWLFFYVLWGDAKMWYYLYAVMLPQVVYSAVIMPIAFYFNRSIAAHLSEEE